MPVMPNVTQRTNVYYHMSTTNASFRDMHFYLKDKGIKNNAFFLTLLDPDLAAIDPRDPRLNVMMKNKILRECLYNYWYFLRECVRIPDQGGQVGSGVKYELHRGNLAMNFGFVRNWNMFVELPRQNYKTVSALARYLWTFNFGSTNSEFMFINKKHEDSKMNLARFRELRAVLPGYLAMEENIRLDGKKEKITDKVETLQHPTNKNSIKTMPSARNKISANSLGRGCTMPIQWYDEYAFIPHVGIIYNSATPAFNTASYNAARNNAPFGILITTTPGDLTTDEGIDAYQTKEMATKFDESFYDMTDAYLKELLSKNQDSTFVHIRYNYQQLGRDEEWFKRIVILMKKDWSAIRREVLLEWSKASDNSPFKKEELNVVKALLKEPIRVITVGDWYQMEIYSEMDLRYPPIIGVDVSGGYNRDSSAITIIDSKTTKVVACLNCNYISPGDLTRVIYELVTKYMPNAIVNVERNGGFGASIISNLMKTSVKQNLFYEIKDRVVEERVQNGRTIKSSQKIKVFGLDSTKGVRDSLIEILRQRMTNHKDKFISPIIFNELEGLEVKRNGRVEHSSNSHDDQIFSYLMALYVWYEGKDLMEKYGIDKSAIKTDSDIEEAILDFEEKYMVNLGNELELLDNEEVQSQLAILNANPTKSYEQWREDQYNADLDAFNNLKQTKLGREALSRTARIDINSMANNSGNIKIPDSVFTDFYN